MRWVLVMLLCGAPAVVCAQAPAAPATPQIAAISSVAVTSGPVVTIAATGPLPTPRVGVLHDPDRIYLDLTGVSTRTTKASGDGAVVTTVRAAQHGVDPLVARIVIDLTQPCSYSVNKLQQAEGHLEISLTPKSPDRAPAVMPASSPASPPAPVPAPAPARTPAPAPVRPPAPAPMIQPPAPRQHTSDPNRRYLAKLKPALDGVATLRRVLEDIDQGHQVPTDRLASARLELGHLQEAVDSTQPPRKFEDVNALLKTVGTFAATALDLASRSTGEVPKNASSAAAGALILLDRAEAQLDQNDFTKDEFAALRNGW